MSRESVKISYRGFDIEHRVIDNAGNGKFFLTGDRFSGGRSREYDTLSKIMEHIDKICKSEFPRTKIIYEDGYGRGSDIREGEATSITEDGEVWIFDYKGDRRKLSGRVFRDTPVNRAIYAKIQDERKRQEKAAREFDQTIERLFKDMDCLNPKKKGEE